MLVMLFWSLLKSLDWVILKPEVDSLFSVNTDRMKDEIVRKKKYNKEQSFVNIANMFGSYRAEVPWGFI